MPDWYEITLWFPFFVFCGFTITNKGRKLAEQLETVILGDSLSPGSTDTAAP